MWTLLLATLIGVCFFRHLDTLGLVGPDEPRYASIARAMATSGDWVTPRLDGKPWFEKPVLYYWAAAGVMRLSGANEFSARMPSALAGALTALVLVWVGCRFGDGEAGWVAATLFCTTVAAIGFSRAATADMLFSAALALSLAAAAEALFHSAEIRRASWMLAFGAALGLATLAKGPAAIVLAGGTVGLWAAVSRRWREALQLAHPWALLAFGVVAIPWYLVCAVRNPDFVQTFLIAHNVQRYLTGVFQHRQPFWFFGPILLAGLMPWPMLLAVPVRDAVRALRGDEWRKSPEFFFACWAIFPFVFFSFSESKLPGYILPVIAPLLLLVAKSMRIAMEAKEPLFRWQLAGVGASFVALAASAGYWLKRLPPDASIGEGQGLLLWGAIVALAGLAIALLGLGWRFRTALALSVLLTAGLVEGINSEFLPQLDVSLSPRAATRRVQAVSDPSDPVYVYQVQRAWHYGLNYYFGRVLPEWNRQDGKSGWILTDAAGLAELERQRLARLRAVIRISPGVILILLDRTIS